MARCNSCSAPLPANTNKCLYCGVRNDVDLNDKHEFTVHEAASNRICPHCDIPLQTIVLKLKEDLFIERCEACFGLFFDPNEVELLLESSVSPVYDINLRHLVNINQDRYPQQLKVKYIKCPVCRQFMRRVNFAHRSGVVVDRCMAHGVWLDSGEITQLMEWKKAGGQLLHVKKNEIGKQPMRRVGTKREAPFVTETRDRDFELSLASIIDKLFHF